MILNDLRMPLHSYQCRAAGVAAGRGAAGRGPPPTAAGRSGPLPGRDRPFHSGQGTLRRRRRRAQARTHARTHEREDARTHARRAGAETARRCGAAPDWRARREHAGSAGPPAHARRRAPALPSPPPPRFLPRPAHCAGPGAERAGRAAGGRGAPRLRRAHPQPLGGGGAPRARGKRLARAQSGGAAARAGDGACARPTGGGVLRRLRRRGRGAGGRRRFGAARVPLRG